MVYISLTELLCYVCFNVKVLKHSLQVFMSGYGDIVNGLDPLDFLMTLRSLVNIHTYVMDSCGNRQSDYQSSSERWTDICFVLVWDFVVLY